MRGKWFNLILASLMVGMLALAGCGDDGKRGAPGAEGMSAYEIAVENGFVGTEAEWLETLQGGTNLVSPQAAETSQCITCHTSFDAAALAEAPFGDEVTQRFLTSRHANQNARSGFCSACHSHEGGKELLSMGRFTSNADLAAAYTAETSAAFLLPVGSDTIVGVNKKTCSTCHTTSHYPTSPGLRGDGDVLATPAIVTGFPATGATQPATGGQAEVRVAYSAEFNLCTACHMVNLDATWNADAGYGGRGMIEYELSAAYTKTKLLEDGSTTWDRSEIFYHDGASGNNRTMADTHFGGSIISQYVNFDSKIDVITIEGYNINPGNANACTICHDPHTGSKLIAKEDGVFPAANGEAANNPAIAYAQGAGKFHTNYLGDAFSRLQVGCTPCHTGDAFVSQVVSGNTQPNERWNVVGCRSCHDLAQPNAAPGANNHEAFAAVREFPDTFEFAFSSGAVVTDDLGVNQICFECHKGRTPGISQTAFDALTNTYKVVVTDDSPATTRAVLTNGEHTFNGTFNYTISYLHYAPAFAILYGDESKMVATYPDKTYAGRFVHPVANAAGSNEFGCIDCHDVHNTNGNKAASNKMTTSASCTGCHAVGSLSPDNLQARTEDYSIRLIDTLLDKMLTFVPLAANYDPRPGQLRPFLTALGEETDRDAQLAMLIDRIKGRQTYFPTADIAKAATTWKVFTYEDGAVHGHDGVHGHGGSWAHNSLFARQMMFDAIEDLGGDLTGLGRR